MSKYQYPEGAISSEEELVSFIKRERGNNTVLWIVVPVNLNVNPLKMKITHGTRIYLTHEAKYEIGFKSPTYTFWIQKGEAAPPYVDMTDNMYTTVYNQESLSFFFPNFWLAAGYAIRTKRLKLAA